MKIETTQEKLKDLFTSLCLVAGGEKTLRPIDRFIKIEAYKERALFYAANDEAQLVKSLTATSELPGVALVPAKETFELIKNLDKKKPVKLHLQDDMSVLLKQGRSRYKLNGATPEGFQAPQYFKSDEYMPMDSEALQEALSVASYCVEKDGFRPALTGVFFDSADEGFFRAVGCDGHRLSCIKMPGVIKDSFILSPFGVETMKRLLQSSEEVGVKLYEGMVGFCLDDGVFNCRTIAKDYPQYRKIIPDGTHMLAQINRADIIRLLKRVSLFSETGKIRILFDKDKISFTTRDKSADALEELELLENSKINDALEMGIDARYLQQACENLGGEIVDVRIYGQNLPLVLSEKNITKLVMPTKI